MSPTELHRLFLQNVATRLYEDGRIMGLGVAGSWITQELDEHSDLDFVVAVADDAYTEVMNERLDIASRLGPLLSGFTGEHVGEPRVLICLYGPPLLHVDFKYVRVSELANRVDDPEILWERDHAFTRALQSRPAHWPPANLQWLEDRFWVWIHYAATKVARGELFECIDFLAFLRGTVLGPLALTAQGLLPRGVRKLETNASALVPRFVNTLATHDARSCAEAVAHAASLYQELRDQLASPTLLRHQAAEQHALAFLDEVKARVAHEAPGPA